MSAFDWGPLRKTVQDAIDRGQIGRPAALRMTVHGPGGAAKMRALEGELRELAHAWLGGPSESDYSTGGGNGAAVIALKWKGGQSAILGVSAGSGRPGGNLMLIGSNGTIYHEVGPATDRERQARRHGSG